MARGSAVLPSSFSGSRTPFTTVIVILTGVGTRPAAGSADAPPEDRPFPRNRCRLGVLATPRHCLMSFIAFPNDRYETFVILNSPRSSIHLIGQAIRHPKSLPIRSCLLPGKSYPPTDYYQPVADNKSTVPVYCHPCLIPLQPVDPQTNFYRSFVVIPALVIPAADGARNHLRSDFSGFSSTNI